MRNKDLTGQDGMKELLEKKYKALCKHCSLDCLIDGAKLNLVLKKMICRFVEQCDRPAIWCYGKHTKMLMSDFMFELRKVRYIIDNGIAGGENSGFEIIKESDIVDAKIDGVIISSRIYKDEIADRLKANFNGIKYLDIYEEFEREGIHLDRDYYDREHPYSKYRKLNQHQRKLAEFKDSQSRQTVLKKIIKSYIEIKDFRSAIRYTERLIQESGDEWGETLLARLNEIYELQLEATEKIHKNNVVMLCIDGLRRKDITEQTMKSLSAYIREKMYYFDNAYSVSTSTYESLIPAYSENDDLRTGYFQENRILGDKCRFIKEAKKQRRKIFFYTDGTEYVVDDEIHVTPYSQTATEKLWDFLLDAVDEHNGLFYVHILYESHFAYPNPYTMETIVGEGTSILFDFLKKNGGRLQADYVMQQKDALRYLDDTAVPLIERLHCGIVLYADHGNILLGKETKLRDIKNTKYTFHEDLIQVPLAFGYPGIVSGTDRRLISIMELNNIVNTLMKREKYLPEKKAFIKILRSEIYNPDFRYLYKKIHYERGLEAFEVFIFEDGYKLAVYADGSVELYLAESDREIDDAVIKKRLLVQVKGYITVCERIKTVSVIVPVFKGNSYIPKIIHMLEENWKTANNEVKTEIEVVFVNDYPEETLELEERKEKNISWIIVENEQNSGIHFSRVQGLLCSKGDYILFLDQDDEISPVYVREQMKALKDYDAVICNGKNYSNLIYGSMTELREAVHVSNYKKGVNQIVAPGQVLLRREAIPSEWMECILDSNGADDYLLWMLLFWKGRRMTVQNKVLYWHQISDSNTSGNWDEMDDSVIEMAERMKDLGYLTGREAEDIRKTRRRFKNKREVSYKMYEQEKKYKLMLELWMTLRERKISVENFFLKMGIKRIAVYGGGIFGRHLCYELRGSSIEVLCIMDRNRDVTIEGLQTIEPGKTMGSTDAIIVTPFMQYTQIKEKLKEWYSCKIISIEAVLFNADCKLEEE